MDLSIIIVNWNSKDYLAKCLESIYSNIKSLQYEVIVIDNASYDGADEIINKEYPSVRFIQSSENLGFARANNMAFKASTGSTVLFLNPDTEVRANAIELLYGQLQKLPMAGAVGPTLLNADMSVQTTCIQAFPTLLNQALDLEVLRMRFARTKIWGIAALSSGNDVPAVVEVISGASLMVRRDVFENVGMFSTDYFMYTEDIDLCYKIRTAGYKAYYVKNARVIHHGGKSSGKHEINFLGDVLMRDSVSRFIRKSRGPLAVRLYKFSMTLSALARLAAIASMMPFTQSTGKSKELKAIREKWKKILAWSIGGEQDVVQLNTKNNPKLPTDSVKKVIS
jgi:N-acetylglucosaminyl-diphospho-decaprenol L-rhamnosyltransferase